MNTAKSSKNQQIPATATTAELNSSNDALRNYVSPDMTIATAVSNTVEPREIYESLPSPECPNSPNITMAGSPRGEDRIDLIYTEILHFPAKLNLIATVFRLGFADG